MPFPPFYNIAIRPFFEPYFRAKRLPRLNTAVRRAVAAMAVVAPTVRAFNYFRELVPSDDGEAADEHAVLVFSNLLQGVQQVAEFAEFAGFVYFVFHVT